MGGEIASWRGRRGRKEGECKRRGGGGGGGRGRKEEE